METQVIHTDCGSSVYVAGVPALASFRSVPDLRRAYESGDGCRHWFSPDTLRFFGSRGLSIVAGAFTLERQTKAPEGVPQWKVTGWECVAGVPETLAGGCRHESRAAAAACVRATVRKWVAAGLVTA